MTFFRTAKTLLTWQEPAFFAGRMRDRRGWMLRGLLALVIFVGMMAAMHHDRNRRGGRGPKFSVAGSVALSAFIGVFLTAVLDAADFSRQVTITDDSISSFGNAGAHMSLSTWALRDVLGVRLIPPEELGRSFGAMELHTRKELARVGVPAKVSMRRIAEVLHGQGISVSLTGWDPAAAAAEPAATATPTPPAPSVMPSASARVERLDEGEAGRILSPFVYRLAVAMTFAPLVATVLPGLVLLGVTLYQLKVARANESLAHVAALFGGIGLIVLGFWFAMRFSGLAPSLLVRGVARSVIEARPGALFDPRGPEAVYVDVVPRANWGKAMLREFSDTGLLKVDELSRSLLFEGDQERWAIPASSLVSVEVESYRPASHVEGQEGGEQFFVTVIRANVGGEVWEAPVTKCHVELRPKNNRLRESNALALRDRIRALRPSLAGTAGGAGPGAPS